MISSEENQTPKYKFSVAFNPNATQKNFSHLIEKFGMPSTIIEIGCYEGHTTVWLAEGLGKHNLDLQLHCIDPHSESVDIHESMEDAHNTFTHNISICPHKNINYIRKKSEDGLIDLINQGVQAELIYIDGDHFSSVVLTDLVLSYKLLKVGGVMLCDDATEWRFKDKNGTFSAQMNPRMAIENFLQCYWEKMQPLWIPDMYQTALLKLA